MSEQNPQLRVDAFDYDLPPDLIAQTPIEPRDASRLMVVDCETGALRHERMRSLPAFLREGDLLVVNNTKVLPARIHATKRDTGGRVELLLLHRDPSGVWTCLAKPAKSMRPGTVLLAERRDGGATVTVEVVDKLEDGQVTVRFDGVDAGELEQIGSAPLPPYIRTPLTAVDRYQTLYARIPGSAAAPTAGLHFTDELRAALYDRGVAWAEVTLHIGLDTFRPVTVTTVAEHTIHREWCTLSPATAEAVLRTRAQGGRVVAVGTTSARTLESWASFAANEPERGFEGWSDLFITPGYVWKAVDVLLTNFHLPRSTLLMMVSSFAGTDLIRCAYRAAIDERYRFYSFGDAMLLVGREHRPVTAGSG